MERGEVVIFWSPKYPEKMAVKRIIALEGDTVYPDDSYPFEKQRVPIGHVWVEGENPDSRNNIDSHRYGPVIYTLIPLTFSLLTL